jgi:hypothetical protein
MKDLGLEPLNNSAYEKSKHNSKNDRGRSGHGGNNNKRFGQNRDNNNSKNKKFGQNNKRFGKDDKTNERDEPKSAFKRGRDQVTSKKIRNPSGRNGAFNKTKGIQKKQNNNRRR